MAIDDALLAAQARHLRHLQRRVQTLERQRRETKLTFAWRLSAPLRHAERAVQESVQATHRLWMAWPRLWSLVRRLLIQGGFPALFAEVKRRRGKHAQTTLPAVELAPSLNNPSNPDSQQLAQRPSNDSPRLSIILIATEEDARATLDCLSAIADQAGAPPHEILLLANDLAAAATLGPVQGLCFPNLDAGQVLLVRSQQAARQARGRALLFLTDQMLARPNAVAALFNTLSLQSDLGAVGAVAAKHRTPSHQLIEAGQILWRDGSATKVGAGEHPETPAYAYLREVDAGSLACLMLPTSAYTQVGGLDTGYETLEYAGIDLCLALRAQGLRILYQPDAELIQATTQRQPLARTQALQRDRQRLSEKWAEVLPGYFPPGVASRTERDRLPGPRLLWVEACMLTPDQDSGSLRTLRLMTTLQALGCKISVAADRLERQEPYTHDLQQRGIEVLYRPYYRSVESLIEQQAEEYDLIILSRHYVARRYAELVRRVAPHALLVFDTVDLHFLRLRRQQAWDKSATLRRLADIAYRDECQLARLCDLTLVVSDVEARALQQEVPAARIEILSNVHDPVAEVPGVEGRRDLFFVGGFQHPPNVDAVEYFVNEIWPLFRSKRPDVKAFVIGSRMPAGLRSVGEKAGLHMLGYVDDLQPYLQGCRFSIAPLRYGAGVKGKVNQSLSHGLPVVATSVATEGMQVSHGQELLVADSSADFARAMLRLYEDDELWRQLSVAARASVAEQFGTSVARAKLLEILDLLKRP